ncbi:MAG: transcription antitermination factor NusB [Anaerolineales bacterium]|nr:transcription antitermination factor NusB [Anaerolineales bacterium]
MKSRTRARAIALQVLYELDFSDHLPGEALKERLDETASEENALSPDLEEFARQIVFGILPIREELDRAIASSAPEWPAEQLAAIDRNLLRIACWEFAVARITPLKVAINEAVELAKRFGSDSTARFVNGTLGALAEREQEIYQALKKETPQEDSES